MGNLKLRLKMSNFFSEKLKVNSEKYQFGLMPNWYFLLLYSPTLLLFFLQKSLLTFLFAVKKVLWEALVK